MRVIYLLVLYWVFAISYIVSPIRHFNCINGIIRYESSLDSMSSTSDGKSSSNSNDRLSSSTSSINNLDKIENIDENVDEDEDSHFIRFPYKIPESSIIRSSTISANSKERSMRIKRVMRKLKYWEQKSAENLGLPNVIDFTNINTTTTSDTDTKLPKSNTKFNAFLSRRLKGAAEKVEL